MRVAWVTPYLPAPATSGGAIRQTQLARGLAAVAEVHLFAGGEPWERLRLGAPELACFKSRWLGRDYLPGWLDRTPIEPVASRRVVRGSPRALWRALAAAHQSTPFDGVVVSHCWGARGAARLGLRWLLDEHNIESQFFRDLAQARSPSARAEDPEFAALGEWERSVWRRATRIVCVSVSDAAAVQAALPRDAQAPLVVENGADLERIDFLPPRKRRGGVLFVGALHHAPNVRAATRLLTSIMPRVWTRLPGLSLTIVGAPVPRALERCARDARGPIGLLGRVPEVAHELARHRVFANPLDHGAGSSLKTIEALAAGIPLVSTATGARGFQLVAGEHFAHAERDDEFASAIVAAAVGGDEWDRMALAGRGRAERAAWRELAQRFAEGVTDAFTA